MTVKKAYADLVEFLQANEDKKIKSVLPQVIEMVSAKSGGGGNRATTFHRNEAGEVVAINCFYFGLWMSPNVVEFGKKANSSTGFNTMCKEGVSKWTKQQRDAKKAKEELLAQVATGEIEPSKLPAALDAIEAARKEVGTPEDGYGFESLEDCLADAASRGLPH